MEGFVILIGSCARGTQQAWSDVDVLRIQSHDSPDVSAYGSFVSYIDLDRFEFESLYKKGSLFLMHAFTEGTLLCGNPRRWSELRSAFVLTRDHSSLIREYLEVMRAINSSSVYKDAYVPYLSNTCRAMKNIGIGVLAQKKKYIFEKQKALELGCHLSTTQTKLLLIANNIFERGWPLDSSTLYMLKAAADDWGANWKSYMERSIQ